jgi:hypothetical protein
VWKIRPYFLLCLLLLLSELIRNQQVVGSNPTGGSKNIFQIKDFYMVRHFHLTLG